MMHILIGILQHNKYGITKRCIDKIIENTNDVSYDIFLIDNGSMDGSANSIKKIYNEIDNIKIVLNEKNVLKAHIEQRKRVDRNSEAQEIYLKSLHLNLLL